MKSHQFRAILDWRMCSDPFPQGVDMEAVDEWIAEVSRQFGFADWADAYHNLQVEGVFKQMGIAGNPDFPSVKKETP